MAKGNEPAQCLKTPTGSIKPPFKSFKGHKQETARYDLTLVSTSLEKNLPQRAMNKVWSQRETGEED